MDFNTFMNMGGWVFLLVLPIFLFMCALAIVPTIIGTILLVKGIKQHKKPKIIIGSCLYIIPILDIGFIILIYILGNTV